MKLYRFSPIKSEEELIEAIRHTHLACFELCKKAFGHYLPAAGNIGIFCHYDEEYKFLTELRKQLTQESDNINQKYFRLHENIVIPSQGDVPETTYTHLYIRQPDPYRAQVGDVDFVIEESNFKEVKTSLQEGKVMEGARIFPRADLDMIELLDPDVDALVYVGPWEVTEKVRVRQ